MKKILFLVLPAILALALYHYVPQLFSAGGEKQKPSETNSLYLPAERTGDDIYHYTGFSLSYNDNHEQADWVAYELTDAELEKKVKRSDRFIPDPNIASRSAQNDDYRKSGYSRGHLAPAADMAWSPEAMEESFYFSNISPQTQEFNNGIWRKLEEDIRRWAKKYKSVHIVTGPVFTEGMKRIGKSRVSVPEYFFKSVLVYWDGSYRSLAFIIPQNTTAKKYTDHAVSIDEIESKTGLDLFYQLPDSLESVLESKVNKNFGK